MAELQKDLREFLELLLLEKVEFVIVGAHAVAFHGHPRLTGDIDFLLRSSKENAYRIVKVCNAFGFSGEPFTINEFLKPEQTFQLGRPPNRIDILTSISGVDNESVWLSREIGFLGDFSVGYISRDLLIKNKEATGRAKDQADVDILKRRQPEPEVP